MLIRNSKSIFSLILAIALVISMFPTHPSSVAYAAVTNLLPSTLTLNDGTNNGNIKASSQNSTRTAVKIGSDTWTQGSNTVYSTTSDPSNLWAAIDLGSPKDIESFIFHTSTNDENTIIRSSQYEVSYSNDPLLWNDLSTKPNNNLTIFSPTDKGWTSAAIVPTNNESGTVANGTYSWSLVGGSLYTSNLTFTAPITARYILINYTLNPSVTGQLGIGLLQIIPPVTLSASTGVFYKSLQNTLSTQLNLDTDTSFSGITNGSETLMEGTDYTVDEDNLITFSNDYLNSLNGSYNLSFNVSSSQGTSSLPYALTVVAAADSSLSPQGDIFIPMAPSIVSTTMNLNSNNFTNISDGTTILSESAYEIVDNTITFNQSYLDTLSMGVHPFVFNFNQGNPQTFMLTISGEPPAANIDYRYWTLQEPLPGGAGQTSEALQAGYADPYFYIGADGSQVFMDTAVGGTTPGSAHPRTELREYDPIAETDAGWLPIGTNELTSTVAVTTLGTLNGVGWTTIGQVFDTETTTLCELEYGYDPARPNGNIRILYEPSGINSLGYQYPPIKIPLNEYFTYKMTLNDGVLSIYINGDLIFNGQTASPSQIIPPTHHYYFKAGNYDQTAVKGEVNYVPYTVVQFTAIDVYHGSTVSSNADLNSLTLSNGTLSPVFASGTTAYSSTVAYGVSNVTVTASVDDSNATMTVNRTPVTSGQASSAINLNVGNNVIPIVVTATNGTTKTYNIAIYRESSSSDTGTSTGGSGSTPNDNKVTATDGKLTLPVGKTGEVSLGNEVVVSIPANATDKDLQITLEKLADTQNLLNNNEVLVSSVFEILKNFSQNFNHPITLTFTFDQASLKDNQTVQVFYYDEVKKAWIEVSGGKINGNKITVEVNHFTKFAVFAVDDVTDNTTAAINLSDIADHWAEANIKQAVNSGIVKGYPDGTFKPNHSVTRAEFVVMLMNTVKPQGEGAVLTFTDTAEIGIWAQKAVAQAFQSGIVRGYGDGSFRPNAEITRAEMAVMLANALNLTAEANAATSFADDKDIPTWSKGAVAALKEQKLVEGKGANVYAPMSLTTRAETVTVLLNTLAQENE